MNQSDTSTLPIGVFDSGVGGLTVARAIADRLPHEKILYLGDTARVPYGNRGAQTVRRYALNAARLLQRRGVKALVIACNTATAYGLDALLEAMPELPIIGVIDPVAQRAAEFTESRHIGVIGTRGTVNSECYPASLTQLAPDIRVTQVACPLFVPLAEEGWTSGEIPVAVAHKYLEAFSSTDIDALILGCTHYPLLRDTIANVLDQIMPRYVRTMDSAHATSAALELELDARGLLSDRSEPPPKYPSVEFLVTDEPRGFMGTAVRFFGGPIQRPQHVDIIMEEV